MNDKERHRQAVNKHLVKVAARGDRFLTVRVSSDTYRKLDRISRFIYPATKIRAIEKAIADLFTSMYL